MSCISVGINISYFFEEDQLMADGGVSIAVDGVVRFAMAEERASRQKYDGGFEACLARGLQYLSLSAEDIDLVGVVGFAEILSDSIPSHLEQMVRDHIGPQAEIVYSKSHHEAHAWTAICQGDSQNALVVVADHTGNILEMDSTRLLDKSRCEQTSYYLWNGYDLKLLARDHDGSGDLGYGRFYSKVTRFVGFESYHDSGKLMGLAPFGSAIRTGLPEAYSAEALGEVTEIGHGIASEDGLADLTEWALSVGPAGTVLTPNQSNKMIQKYADLASWCQDSLETSVLRRVKSILASIDVEKIYMSGGVALNSVLNAAVERELGIPVFVPSSPGDAGLSLGALAYANASRGELIDGSRSPYLGPMYTSHDYAETLESYVESHGISFLKVADPETSAATRIADGEIIAWFQDRSEFGPRALGNRSILASVENPWTKDVVNQMVKHREWFRPLAPAVLFEEFHTYFDSDYEDFNYMMKTARVNVAKAHELPTGIHIDGSARVQTVIRSENPKFHKLISAVYDKTGTPMVMNTSFNLGGSPLVESPADVLECFLQSEGIAALYLGDFEVLK